MAPAAASALLTRPTATAAELALAGPRLLARSAAPAVGAVAGAAAGTARAGVRGADGAARVGRVVRDALPGRPRPWRSGTRAHLALRAEGGVAGGTEHRARRVAAALADHPDVAFAYWDGGLSRLVVAATEDTAMDRVLDHASALAARHGLGESDERVEEFAHPGDPAGVRTAAAALAADLGGIAVAFAGSALRLPVSPRAVTAVTTLLRENPRFRGLLRARIGRSRMDLALAVANAAVHGAGRTPTALALDGALRACQVGETVARAAAFDAVHDEVCRPDRTGVPAGRYPRPPLRTSPAQEYAAAAATGSMVGAAATLLVKHDLGEAAEAVLAGSPKAARYGPAAFHAVLAAALSRAGVLVRDTERLAQLETADTLVLHPSALLAPSGGADPWAEEILEAARRAGLRVVVVDHPALADFTGLADHVADPERPLAEVVARQRERHGGTVVTVARVPAAVAEPAVPGRTPATAGDTAALGDVRDDVLEGLLGGDVAVALTDGDAAVVWGADVLARQGPADVWRLLTAVPAARAVGRRSQTLARSGAVLSGLLVAVGESRRGRPSPWPGLRHAPVDAAAAVALYTGARAALGVAVARAPHPRPRVAWHALKPGDVRRRLHEEPEARPGAVERATLRARALGDRAGKVRVLAPARWTWQLGRAVRGELGDPLTPVLAVGSAASAILGSAVDALLVLGALDLNALVGGVQRLRAERALSGLLDEQKRKARVSTGDDGPAAEPRTVDAAGLHPGDVIALKADDVVPADARLLWEDGLEVDESALTGESLPVDKQTAPTPRAAVADRSCMVFEGTTVVAGQARAVVVDTGDHTESARAVHLAARTPPAAGVQARLQELTRKALPLTMAGGAAVTGLALLRGTPLRRAVGGGVAVAVAAVPEGLPLVATVAQLAAARRLSRRGVLVRAPRTLEALGRMDTVCFDKTGTLTENRLRLVRLTDADGTVHRPDDVVETEAGMETLRAAARACPRANGDSARVDHATDEAVLDAARPDPGWRQEEYLPFEAARGYAAAVGREAGGGQGAGGGRGVGGGRVLVVKGAPETVLPAVRGRTEHATETAHALADDGLRVLAVAHRPLADGESAADVLERPLSELEFIGLLALADTPRESSTALVRGLREAGVRPVMLTGDHPGTARAIAAELGWPEDTTVVTGDELAAADRSARARMLRDVGVVARVAPEQKLQVIESLRDAGRVVAMVGDGANDAAAIRAADIGVGISARGSAAARNAADLVLTDDDMTVLVEAVTEGRALWRSVADAIAILIGGNAGEVSFGILGTLLSGSAPLSTRQMLLVNLFTDLFPAMAVAVTPKEQIPQERPEEQVPVEQALDEQARADDPDTAPEPAEPLVTALLGEPLLRQIRHRAATTCLGATAAWLAGRFTPGTARRSTTMALCGVVGTQLAQTLTDRRDSPLVRVTVFGSAAALVALVQTPGLSQLFGCTPLGPVAWAGVAAALVLAVVAHRRLPGLERAVLAFAGRHGMPGTA
ncbi:cation-transporting ATPase I [Streptomyces sp. B3I7]|uniref:cation-translocating P-type ATPase n=1 Tax=Streptomyces sp. B3I7 TaxID=3042269 RepID=UPI002784F531|nr:cation-translocating P-type ATPase [Streptomyces sp. B3I7]MDQ0813542.1 cation-transporting ATPase I [Streptomyces sp. B3I7]